MATGKSDQRAMLAAVPRINLRQLAVFVATAREGSTRAAADRVSRSQSAASATLAALESALGAELFDRIGRSLVLNENGRVLLPHAASLLDQAAEVQQLLGAEHQVRLHIAASLTIGEVLLPGILARWKQEHPASSVQLKIGNTLEVVERVASLGVDLGFIEGSQSHPDLVVQPWLDDQLAIVCAPHHPLAASLRGKPPGLQLLRECAWALREPGSGTREAADRWLLEHLGALHVEFELGSPEALKRVVGSGCAVGCLSRRSVERELRDGTLVELKPRIPAGNRRLAIVRHRGRRLGPSSELFLRYCLAA